MKKKFALLLCSTGNEAFAVGNVIIGAKKYLFHSLDNNEYDVIFYTDKLLNQDEKALKTIFPKIIINIYNFPFKIENNKDVLYYSLFSYVRYEAFNLLNNYKKVLYMDSDMVIQKDISHILYNDKMFYAYYYLNSNLYGNNTSNYTYDKLKIKYDVNVPRICSAIFLVRDTLPRYHVATQWCYDQINTYVCNDETILNIFLQEFSIEVSVLSEYYNCMPTSSIVKDAYIIHSLGPSKFWRGTYNEDWENNNKEWISCGGSQSFKDIERKRNFIFKLVWFIPSSKLRNKVRYFLLNKIGLSGR